MEHTLRQRKLYIIKFCIGLELIYNAVLLILSGIQQSESVIHTSTLLEYFPHIGHYKVLSRVLCATVGSCVCVLSHSVVFCSLWPQGLQPTRLLSPWEFSQQEYWRGLPFPTPGDLPNPGIEPASPTFAGRFFATEAPWKPTVCAY